MKPAPRLFTVLLALCAPASAAPPFATLEKVRSWPVYDSRVSGATDIGDLCRRARLPCGLVAAKGETLEAPPGAIAGLTSLTGDREDARYLRVQVIVHAGSSVRRTLDAIARGDGRMLWRADSDGTSCVGFRFRDWRAPQPVETSSVLVSVSGPKKNP